MDYFDYSYKHNYIEFSSTIYRVGTYHYNWHGETEILILLKGRIEMSCNDELFTLEPLDAVIISPQVGHSTLALEEDVIAFTIHVGNEFYQQYDPDFGSYQFVVRSDESTRHNQFFTTLRHHAAMMMLLMAKGESHVHCMWIEHHYLALAGDVFREFEPVKFVHENARPGDIKPATFDKMIAYIDEHYRQKLELEDIAKIGGYNVAYTSQFFKRQMGIPIMTLTTKLILIAALILSIIIPFGYYLIGERNRKKYKRAIGTNVFFFFGAFVITSIMMFAGPQVQAADAAAASSSLSTGLGYLAAALVTGLSCIGGGIAVASAASAALGAISEDSSVLGKSLIFVGLAEGVCLYGLIISFMILGKL